MIDLIDLKVLLSEDLPPGTIIASPDIYRALAGMSSSPKQEIDNIVRLSDWIKERGQPK